MRNQFSKPSLCLMLFLLMEGMVVAGNPDENRLLGIVPAISPDEERVYQFISGYYYENGDEVYQKSTVLNKNQLPILFNYLEDTCIQNEWIERAFKEYKFTKDDYHRKPEIMKSHAMNAIAALSTESTVMERMYRFIDHQIKKANNREEMQNMISGFYALAYDTTGCSRQLLLKILYDVDSTYNSKGIIDKGFKDYFTGQIGNALAIQEKRANNKNIQNRQSITEESVYRYVSIIYIDRPEPKETELEYQQLKTIGKDGIPILLKVLQDDSTQKAWISRLVKDTGYKYDNYGRARTTIVSQSMYALADLSSEPAQMEVIQKETEKLFQIGSTIDDVFLSIAAICALSKDTTKEGIQRLEKVKKDIENDKYSFKSFEGAFDDKHYNHKNHFLNVITDQQAFRAGKMKENRVK